MNNRLARAEIRAFDRLIAELPQTRDTKNNPRDILTYGYVMEGIRQRFDEAVQKELEKVGDEPLSFNELTSYSTWFRHNPDKNAGDWKVTTSIHFPVQIESSKEKIISAVKGEHKNLNLFKMKLKAKAIKTKLKLANSLQGVPISPLNIETRRMISSNNDRAKKLLHGLSGLTGTADTYSFDDIDRIYNQGITDAEKKAWVWFKMRSKEPMNGGWKKYAISGKDSELKALVKSKSLFYCDNELMPYPIYAFANTYDRQLQLDQDKEHIVKTYGQDIFDHHQKVINDAKPRPLSVMNPDPKERPKILAISNLANDFRCTDLKEELGVEINKDSMWYDAELGGTTLRNLFGLWLKTLKDHEFKNVGAYEIWNYYVLAGRMPKYMDEAKKDTIDRYAPQEGEDLFSRFLYEGLRVEDQQKLDFYWNRIYNGWSSIPYHRIPIGFECSAKFKGFDFAFTPIQREGVAFIKSAGSGIIAYDVGVGKTITAIITALNDLYSGKCKRPIIVVPNATYIKWIREIFGYTDEKSKKFIEGVASHTGIKLNDWYNLGSDVVKKIKIDEPPAPGTITMVTYEGLAKMGYSQDAMGKMLDELAKILAQTDDDDKSQRDLEKKFQKLKELLGTGNKGTIVDFDKLLFDYIVIDEAHNFRNVFSYVPQDKEGNKRFQISGAESARAQKAFFLCNYIQRTYGANVMLLTATPFTNNPIEIYSMTSLVGYNNMVKMGINNLFAFMELFVNQSVEYVNSYDGTIVQRPVVKAFNNRLILQKLIYNHINYKTGEEAGVKRPCKINLPKTTYMDDKTGQIRRLPADKQLTTYLSMNDLQRENQAEITRLAQDRSGSIQQIMANVMRALARSLDNALSPFIYDSQPLNELMPDDRFRMFVDQSPKIKYTIECVKSVKEHHEAKNENVSGQVIYMNRGKDYFAYIKQYLEDMVGFAKNKKFNGRKIDEVEILTSEVSQSMREHVKDAFLAGDCKIIIGTATIREGIDLQKNGTVIYNLYPDWNPTDLKQLEGRVHRQGNNFGYVRVVMPLVQDSMDVFVFQKLEEKTSRINDIWYRADRGNVLEVDALDPEEVKFALFTNLSELAKIVIDKEEREISRRIKVIESDIDTMKRLDFAIRKRAETRQLCLAHLDDWKKGLAEFPSEIERYAQRWGATPGQMKEYEDRAKELLMDIEKFQEGSSPTDKSLLTLSRAIQQSTFSNKFVIDPYRYDFDMFKDFSLQVQKAEKTVLLEKGYTLETDFNMIIEELNKEQAKVLQEMADLKSPENVESIIADIARKKAENRVDGRSAEGAAEDFISLNYLLDYKFKDIDADSCELPEPAMRVTKRFDQDNKRLNIPAIVRKILPDYQRRVINFEHQEVMNRLEQIANQIPKLYHTDKLFTKLSKEKKSQSHKVRLEDIATAYLHYFIGQTDIWVLEADYKEELFYTFTILNGDVEMAEFGLQSIKELRETRIELDFYFKPVILQEALHNADPSSFDPYVPVDDPEPLKLKLKLRAKAIKIKLKLKAVA